MKFIFSFIFTWQGERLKHALARPPESLKCCLQFSSKQCQCLSGWKQFIPDFLGGGGGWILVWFPCSLRFSSVDQRRECFSNCWYRYHILYDLFSTFRHQSHLRAAVHKMTHDIYRYTRILYSNGNYKSRGIKWYTAAHSFDKHKNGNVTSTEIIKCTQKWFLTNIR